MLSAHFIHPAKLQCGHGQQCVLWIFCRQETRLTKTALQLPVTQGSEKQHYLPQLLTLVLHVHIQTAQVAVAMQ
jgi:hypothetical protein